ncbi:hypothetical protein ACF0H5_003254 [Mactra antiquata]
MSKNKGENALREAAWQEILAAVNEEAHFPRTLEQVKKQYENLKMRGFNQFIKKKPTTPQPILPKPPPTATIITSATPTSLSKTSVSTTSSYQDSPYWNINGGSETNFNDKDHKYSQHTSESDQTIYTTSATSLKTTDTRAESMLIQQFEIERIQAETQKHKAETELIFQRRECEYAIFEMKRKVLQAKLEYYRSNKMIKPKIEVTSDDENDTS